MGEFRILFCCMGNICRSPMAEGVFRKLLEEAGLGERVEVDSAGTLVGGGNLPPDPRAQRLMAEIGIDISGQRSRAYSEADCRYFDLIVALDGQNYDSLRFARRAYAQKIKLLLDFAPKRLRSRDVPDPFNGDEDDFRKALELIRLGAGGLLEHVRQQLDS